jgi:hypothetical protein
VVIHSGLEPGEPLFNCWRFFGRLPISARAMVSGKNPQHHRDIKGATFVPTTQPAHAPAIDVVAQLHGLTKPHEFRLQVTHANAHAHACLCVAELSTGRMPLRFPLWATCRTPDREARMVAGGQPP